MAGVKFPYRGVIVTEFGGTSFKRALTIAEAEAKAKQQAGEIGNIRVAKMYVTDTKGNVIKDLMMKQNPAPKRKTAASTQKAAESYVRRPSQITKKAPTKRLKKRRTINLQTPRGVFPNPMTTAKMREKARLYEAKGEWDKAAKCWADAIKLYPAGTGQLKARDIEMMTQRMKSALYEAGRLKENPDSIHFDIDVNSHNAKGAKAGTRTNPTKRKTVPKAKRYFIVTDHSSGILYFDGTGFSKLKSSAVDFRTKENVVPRATALADFFNRPMKVMEE